MSGNKIDDAQVMQEVWCSRRHADGPPAAALQQLQPALASCQPCSPHVRMQVQQTLRMQYVQEFYQVGTAAASGTRPRGHTWQQPLTDARIA
jgi:hypothetical protein